MIHKKTGVLINPYFSASKIRYILDHLPSGQARAEAGELMFGTVDTWLIYKLTNETRHVTDITNASRTMLFNINTLDWDDEILKVFNIPKSMLPKVLTTDDFGLRLFNTIQSRGLQVTTSRPFWANMQTGDAKKFIWHWLLYVNEHW